MININKLTDEDVGRKVIYTDGVKSEQYGCIKSWNYKWIFIVYNCNDDWDNYQDYTGAATNPSDLRFVKPRPGEEDIESRFDI